MLHRSRSAAAGTDRAQPQATVSSNPMCLTPHTDESHNIKPRENAVPAQHLIAVGMLRQQGVDPLAPDPPYLFATF